MYIEQKQNKIFRPQSNTTLSAEETNQVTTEFNNQIIAGGLTPSASSLTQLRDSIKNVVDTAANNLQEQIDAITSASDVFDVVGTYAQLQAYDKSTVPLNDIVKVLQDSTHNNAATYYRLVDASGDTEWQYIGQEGPYYTKSEIDTDFALKSQLPNIATTQQVGLVKPDGSTTFVGADGTISVGNNITAALPLFTYIWADHLMSDASYLLADTFSWQSGSVYINAYSHLVNDIAGISPTTETIEGTTITYYQADDGHKVVLADQETNVQNIYIATGVAWYYILDVDNTRFKLPRINPNTQKVDITIEAPVIGTGIALGFTNGQVNFGTMAGGNGLDTYQGDYGKAVGTTYSGTRTTTNKVCGIVTDGTKSGIKADLSNKTTVYSGKKYLYFYIGNFSQSATEQTAGLNLELFNSKMDVDGSNATEPLVHFSDFEAFKNLILKEVSNMLGRIDWANGIIGIDIKHTGSQENTYTCPSDGYILVSSLGNGIQAARPLAINHIAVTVGTGGVSSIACLGNLIAVSEGDLVSIEGSTVNYATAVINFYPQKQIEESGS